MKKKKVKDVFEGFKDVHDEVVVIATRIPGYMGEDTDTFIQYYNLKTDMDEIRKDIQDLEEQGDVDDIVIAEVLRKYPNVHR